MRPAPVAAGTAETLARVHHVRQLTDALPEAHELDPVLRFLLGRVTDPAEVLEQLHDELDQLWSLLTEDYDDEQLDELTDADWQRHSFSSYQQEADYRHSLTVSRLVADVEGHIWRARLTHFEDRCSACDGDGHLFDGGTCPPCIGSGRAA